MFTWQFVLLCNQPLEEWEEKLDNDKVGHAIQVAKVESQEEYLERQIYATRAIY
jgi:hypothetical protein